MEGLHQIGTSREKPLVEVYKFNKLMQLGLRLRKVTNSLDFLGKRSIVNRGNSGIILALALTPFF